jgi:hypothetical protein
LIDEQQLMTSSVVAASPLARPWRPVAASAPVPTEAATNDDDPSSSGAGTSSRANR